eukprot:1759611-Amphidinium_carterae.1
MVSITLVALVAVAISCAYCMRSTQVEEQAPFKSKFGANDNPRFGVSCSHIAVSSSHVSSMTWGQSEAVLAAPLCWWQANIVNSSLVLGAAAGTIV